MGNVGAGDCESTRRLPRGAAAAKGGIALASRDRRPTRHRDQHRRKTTCPGTAFAPRRAAGRSHARRNSSRRKGKGPFVMNAKSRSELVTEEQAALWAARLEGADLEV